ncbi:hypothetical protein IWW45_001252 [Coemansia sp. RSA 485]|nr:hypothetical protein IWW45_001252 [Coemansia sp. RSA 485]
MMYWSYEVQPVYREDARSENALNRELKNQQQQLRYNSSLQHHWLRQKTTRVRSKEAVASVRGFKGSHQPRVWWPTQMFLRTKTTTLSIWIYRVPRLSLMRCHQTRQV